MQIVKFSRYYAIFKRWGNKFARDDEAHVTRTGMENDDATIETTSKKTIANYRHRSQSAGSWAVVDRGVERK